MKRWVRVRVIGQRDRLPKSLQEAILKTEAATKNNGKLFLNLAISYGGKWDILNAIKNIIKEGISPDEIDEKLFENHLSTAGFSARLYNPSRRGNATFKFCFVASRLRRTIFFPKTLARSRNKTSMRL